MEFFNFARAAPKPCLCCNQTEFDFLTQAKVKGEEDFWIYDVEVVAECPKCEHEVCFPWNWLPSNFHDKFSQTWIIRCFLVYAAYLWWIGQGRDALIAVGFYKVLTRTIRTKTKAVSIPISVATVGVVERAIHSASVGEKGSEYRAHGTFIKHLVGLPHAEHYKQALCAWAPTAMMAFMLNAPRTRRTYWKAKPIATPPDTPKATQDTSSGCDNKCDVKTHRPPPGLEAEQQLPVGNPDILDGRMIATQLEGNEYGEEDRISGTSDTLPPKTGAFQVGPDLIPTEVFDTTEENMKAGLAKRVKPLPFKADAQLIRRIDRTVTALIDEVFTPEKIQKWRENAHFGDLKSSKWSTERWHQAWNEALAEVDVQIEQTFQIKQNEALPAKGKAPRPIIQCGDVAQVLMKYPVRCFEDLLFEYFEDASIKHAAKHDAMGRASVHLRQRGANLIEGDGSAWDACCNEKIRDLTENRIIAYIIEQLGGDPEVPDAWMKEMLRDMEKSQLKGRVKINGHENIRLKVIIDSIRQSGHAGTSCFNWLINHVCWISILSDQPWKLIGKGKSGKLHSKYRSAFDHKEYNLKYIFEGDDSALSTTENLQKHEIRIEEQWKKLGFRMKLVYVDKKLTFTGFEFLCNKNGPTGTYIPEVARNIASASWSCSSELKMKPHLLHKVGAAAMLARAENFKDCGPLSRYFAALGLAHARKIQDFGLDQAEALRLGIQVSPSVKDALQVLYDDAERMEPRVRELMSETCPMSEEDELRLLACDFGTDPLNTQLARELIPFTVWDPRKFEAARR